MENKINVEKSIKVVNYLFESAKINNLLVELKDLIITEIRKNNYEVSEAAKQVLAFVENNKQDLNLAVRSTERGFAIYDILYDMVTKDVEDVKNSAAYVLADYDLWPERSEINRAHLASAAWGPNAGTWTEETVKNEMRLKRPKLIDKRYAEISKLLKEGETENE